jgi:hypothetical protein
MLPLPVPVLLKLDLFKLVPLLIIKLSVL